MISSWPCSDHAVWGRRNVSHVWGEVKCSETRGPGKPETTWETYSDMWENNVTVGPNVI
jgi:hypothetical protein